MRDQLSYSFLILTFACVGSIFADMCPFLQSPCSCDYPTSMILCRSTNRGNLTLALKTNLPRVLTFQELHISGFLSRANQVISNRFPIQELEPSTFDDFRFKYVHIYETELELIHSDAFASTYDYTKVLNLKSNWLVNGPSHTEYDIFETVNKFTGLMHLDLSDNRLVHVPSYSFGQLSNLKTIQLGSNYIQTIGDHAFYLASNLNYIGLQSNKLTSIAADVLYIQRHSSTIFISLFDNHLNSGDIKSLTGILRPLDLDLSANNITFADRDLYQPLLSQQPSSIVRFKRNPFDCDCRTTAWLVNNRTFYQNHMLNIKCADGVSLWKKSSEELETMCL